MKEELFGPEEAMPVEERERYYNEQVRKVVQFAYDNAPAVKNTLVFSALATSPIPIS